MRSGVGAGCIADYICAVSRPVDEVLAQLAITLGDVAGGVTVVPSAEETTRWTDVRPPMCRYQPVWSRVVL